MPRPQRAYKKSSFASLAGRINHFVKDAVIDRVDKDFADRVVIFHLLQGNEVRLRLYYVAIPGRVDLALVDGNDEVLASLSHSPEKKFTVPKQPQRGISLLDANESAIAGILDKIEVTSSMEAVHDEIMGVDSFFAEELIARLRDSRDSAEQFLKQMVDLDFKSNLWRDASADDLTVRLLPDTYHNDAGELVETFSDPLDAVESLFITYARALEFKTVSSEIAIALKSRKKRLKKLRTNLDKDYQKAEKNKDAGQMGDLILANIHTIRRGNSTMIVENIFYPDNREISIALDRKLDPAKNADLYYRKARKAKRAIKHLELRRGEVDKEIRELGKMALDFENSDDDLKLIRSLRDRIDARGWISKQKKKRSKKPVTVPGRRFTSSDGMEIIIGRNNIDNEVVTFKVGKDNDFWLHTAGYSGSHVVIRNPQKLDKPPYATLQEAASLAAYYSKARNFSNVQVNWTLRRFLKKVKGPEPGKVMLSSYSSVIAQPEIPRTLRQNK